MDKKNESAVAVKFTVPAFRYKGVEYKSADVEKAAEDGDETANAIVANLVRSGSGVVQVTEEVAEPEAPKAPKAPAAPKPPKAKVAKEVKPAAPVGEVKAIDAPKQKGESE